PRAVVRGPAGPERGQRRLGDAEGGGQEVQAPAPGVLVAGGEAGQFGGRALGEGDEADGGPATPDGGILDEAGRRAALAAALRRRAAGEDGSGAVFGKEAPIALATSGTKLGAGRVDADPAARGRCPRGALRSREGAGRHGVAGCPWRPALRGPP